MTIRSAKQKGARLQNRVRLKLLKRWPKLEEGDLKTAVMGESGLDVRLSPAAKRVIPLDIECKNTETLNIWRAIQQAEANCAPKRVPCVIFSRNHEKDWIALPFDTYLKQIK